eukprot:6331207-Pyramimonas_sp.AAC.1
MAPDPVMHRDFKPANILLDERLGVRLADVGLAKFAPELTATGTAAQTYIQVVRGQSAANHRRGLRICMWRAPP